MLIAKNCIGGPFDYTVTGDREADAKKALEAKLDFLSRCYHLTGEALFVEISEARKSIEKDYDVVIGITI